MALRGFWSVVTEPSVRSALRRRLFFFPSLLLISLTLSLTLSLLSAALPALCERGWAPRSGSALGVCLWAAKMPFKWRQWWRNSLLGNFSDDGGRIYIECDTEAVDRCRHFLQSLFLLTSILIFFCSGWNSKQWIFTAFILKTQQVFQMHCTEHYRAIRKFE